MESVESPCAERGERGKILIERESKKPPARRKRVAMTPREIMIANLAAATIMHDDPELSDYFDAEDQRADLVRDYRAEFASSPFPILADAKITTDVEIGSASFRKTGLH